MNAPQTKFRKINTQQSKQRFAKGGFVKGDENADSNKWVNPPLSLIHQRQRMRDYQGTLTGEFASRFPEVNIDSILIANQNRNPAIDHRNFTGVGENLIGQFGDLRIRGADSIISR